MNMHKPLRCIASVFLFLSVVLTVFVSCGFPVLFYVDTTITPRPINPTTIAVDITMSDPYGNLQEITKGTGPSLLLAYVVTDSIEELDARKAIVDDFKKTYQRSSYDGAQIPMADDAPILYKEEDDEVLYALYAFSAETISSALYHATAAEPTQPQATFTIKATPDEGAGVTDLTLTVTPQNEYVIHVDNGNLQRFNTEPFTLTGSGTGYPDYFLHDPPLDGRACHLFAAINVSVGKFTTIYWSNLVYLGAVEL